MKSSREAPLLESLLNPASPDPTAETSRKAWIELQIPSLLDDESLMEATNPLPQIARLSLIGLGLFLAGALLSFAYSYHPLHGANTWKIEELEARLDVRNQENMKIGDELARFRSDESTRVDPETFAQIEIELANVRSTLDQAEKDLERASLKRKEANTSARRWRKRYEKLRDESAVVAVAAPAPAAVVPQPLPARPPSHSQAELTRQPADSSEASPDPPEDGMLPLEAPTPAANP